MNLIVCFRIVVLCISEKLFVSHQHINILRLKLLYEFENYSTGHTVSKLPPPIFKVTPSEPHKFNASHF